MNLVRSMNLIIRTLLSIYSPSPILLLILNLAVMANESVTIDDRVRESSAEERNMEVDQKVMQRMNEYRNLSIDKINSRLEKIRTEWDIERALEVNASSLALTGVLLGTFVSRKWYLLSFIVTGFLLQHGVQGWCPPLPLLRKLGFRTRAEIDEEIYALKALRGDFDSISSASVPEEIIPVFRR